MADSGGSRLKANSVWPGKRPRAVAVAQLVALGGAAVAAIALRDTASWRLDLLLALAACAVAGDLAAASTGAAKLKVSGSFLALVLAMVLLGGPPAAAIGVRRSAWAGSAARAAHFLLNNLVAYAWFPLAGAAWRSTSQSRDRRRPDRRPVLPARLRDLHARARRELRSRGGLPVHLEGSRCAKARKPSCPCCPRSCCGALLAVDRLPLRKVGLGGDRALRGRPARLPVPAARAAALRRSGRRSSNAAATARARTEQLASLQVGVLSAIMHTLDLRDRMTARHCAAVARYAREIARAAGMLGAEQELVHTAGLLHDIGKFIFPDAILKADRKLTDEDWQIISCTRTRARRSSRQIEGYGPVGRHHPRPPRAHRRQGLPARPARRRRSRRCRASSRWPTPTT